MSPINEFPLQLTSSQGSAKLNGTEPKLKKQTSISHVGMAPLKYGSDLSPVNTVAHLTFSNRPRLIEVAL